MQQYNTKLLKNQYSAEMPNDEKFLRGGLTRGGIGVYYY